MQPHIALYQHCSVFLLNEARKENPVLYSHPCPFPQIKCFLLSFQESLFWSNTPLCPSCPPCVHTAETSAGKNLLGLLFHCTSLGISQLIHFPGRNKCTQKAHIHWESVVLRMCQDLCTSYTGDKNVCSKAKTSWIDRISNTNCLHGTQELDDLSQMSHCHYTCTAVLRSGWLSVPSELVLLGTAGQNRWMESAATAAEAQSVGSEAQRATRAIIQTNKNSQLPEFWLNSLPTGWSCEDT